MDEVVIRVDDVYKDFILPHERVGSVKGIFTGMFRHATSKKEKQHALRGVSFEIKRGEFFGIVGRNGSGKSTLLKILAGIYQPTKGEISTHGKLVPFIELGVGFNPELSGRDNVYLNGAMLGFSVKEVDAMYEEIVEFAELERFMDQKLKNYSSGMQVRLAFSVAVKAQADILLVDEVLAVGDADFQNKCFDYFHSLKGKKTTVILVTHDMNSIRQYCDNAVLVENGKIVSAGTASDVATDYSMLFIDAEFKDTTKSPQENKKRWGDGTIKFEKIEIPKKLRLDEPLTIKIWAKAQRDIDSPIFGFIIKNAAREPLMGTNTLEQKKVLDDVKSGGLICVEWVVPNIFSNGIYSIDLAIVYKGGTSVADWWEDASKFAAQKEQASQYTVTPSVNVKVVS